METKKIIILGTGGNCIDILDAINEINLITDTYEVVGFLDDNSSLWGKNLFGTKVLGGLESASEYGDSFFVNGIGSPHNFWKKKEIIDTTNIPVERFESVYHPSASVSNLATVGKGVVVLKNVSVSADLTIGNHVIILPNSVINHNDRIDDYVCIASSVSIAGNVHVENHSYIGGGSSILGNITIQQNSLVGMGSVVIRDVETNTVVAGNPARVIRTLL
jgi:sugar O-acyltransferase (sialic acid O-acetyltransferase NeuD family)